MKAILRKSVHAVTHIWSTVERNEASGDKLIIKYVTCHINVYRILVNEDNDFNLQNLQAI